MQAVRAGARIPHLPLPNALVELLDIGSHGIIDTSLYRNTITATSAVSDSGVLYDGADTVNVQQLGSVVSPSFAIGGDFCFEAFVYYTGIVGGQQCCFFSSRNASTKGIFLFCTNLGYIQATVTTPTSSYSTSNAIALTADVWHHVAVDVKGNNVALALDGSIASTVIKDSALVDSGGSYWSSGKEAVLGINEGAFRYSNRRFTAASRYQSNYVVPTPPLNAQYP